MVAPVRFRVQGQALPGSGPASRGHVQLAALRGVGAPQALEAVPGRDVVVLQLQQGPRLVLHPQTAADLFAAQQGSALRDAPAEVVVTPQLAWAGLEGAAPQRGAGPGWLGQALLQSIEVVAGPVKQRAARLAAAAVTRRLDGRVSAGLYRLSPQALAPLKTSGRRAHELPPHPGPLLVLVHGTFVDTASTFGPLWQHHPVAVQALFDHYQGQVFALDHPTLGASPIDNALTLAQALPEGAQLHLLTHSRGGLVAEVLARLCAEPALDTDTLMRHFGRGHAAQAAALQTLARTVQAKRLQVQRIVRVACPARGTLLASRRLDAYLSVLEWLLRRAGVPLLPELLDFLHEVARRRTEPAELPGLEAMLPGSALLEWLHDAPAPLPGQLRVVAGDVEGDSLASWLKTLLADAFYWTDNDLVVQTRSMYGGVPRMAVPPAPEAALYLLDGGGDVDHFRYFSNPRTVQAVMNALLHDAPRGFAPIGPLSWQGQHTSGQREDRVAPQAEAQRPALFLLPGWLGSHLDVDGQRVWLSWRLLGRLQKLAWDRPVKPTQLLEAPYDALARHFEATHEVHRFAYDWRAPLEREALRLADALHTALQAREATGQPVQLIAHSMGGLLARTLQWVAPAVWQRLFAHPRARLLLLGVPNAGTWAPMQALSGDDPFANTVLAFGGGPFGDHRARQLLAGLPGLLQLQAGLLDPALRLHDATTWQRLADEDLATVRQHNRWHHDERQLTPYEWGVPSQAVLDEAVRLRQRLDAQLATLPVHQLRVVLGRDRPTPDGFRFDPQTGVEYLQAEGDGRVTEASAQLPGVPTWQVSVPHGRLPAETQLFETYAQLLTDAPSARGAGPATSAPVQAPAVEPRHVASRPSRSGRFGAQPLAGLSTLLDTGSALLPPPLAPPLPALALAVRNADLRPLDRPLMLGHYRSLRLTGTEAVVDRALGGALSAALRAGVYPGAAGTHQVFDHRSGKVVVVGLGDEGRLRVGELQQAVRQSVVALAQRQAEQPGAGTGFELATTLLGSGGAGVWVGQAAQAIAQGVREANAALLAAGWPLVQRLVFVELYLDRATEAWSALEVLRDSAPAAWQLAPVIEPGAGALRRPLEHGYRGVGYDLVSALASPQTPGRIDYVLDTRRARTEVHDQATQPALLRELVAAAADERQPRPELGPTLFQLLVPASLEPFLVSSTELVLELDAQTAALPWELLQPGAPGDPAPGGTPPWSVRCKLLRKLRTEHFREAPQDSGREGGVLVVGEPETDPQTFSPLPGARAEALAVAGLLGSPALVDAPALQIVDALLAGPYRVVHIAGHGMALADGAGGVVLSNGHLLGAREIETMRTVPELVFVNCCHLGRIDAHDGLQGQRVAFAAQVAEQLIRIGVRCVVAAGWAVDDEAARDFALQFYSALLQGRRFIDAVATARQATWAAHPQHLTWAAYQCYGDPDWVYRAQPLGADVQPFVAPRHWSIASAPALALALETLAVRAAGGAPEAQALQQLQAEHGPRWGDIGAVAEAFGVAFEAIGDAVTARQWFQRAADAADGSASLQVLRRLRPVG